MAPSRSWTLAGWTTALSSRPSVSTRGCGASCPWPSCLHRSPTDRRASPFSRALHALAVDDGHGRARLFARLLAHLDEEGMVQARERAVPGPQAEIVMHRALRRQILGQGAPLAARCQHIEDPVQHLAHIHPTPAAAALGGRDERLGQRPLGIGEVARVAQARTTMGLPLLHRPHRISPPCPTSSVLLTFLSNKLLDRFPRSATLVAVAEVRAFVVVV